MDISQLPIISRSTEGVLQARQTGYKGYLSPDSPHRFRGRMGPMPIIPRSEWTKRIEAIGNTTIADRFHLPAKDQNGLSYCWVYGSTRAVEYRRAIDGLTALDLSPESVGGPCTNWRNEGGYASEAFAQLQAGGACQAKFMDSPHSLRPRFWDPIWVADALSHQQVDWIDLEYTSENGPFDNVITALLNGNPVAAGLDWWGHLVCFVAAVILPVGKATPNTPDGAAVGVLFQNSWGKDWPTPAGNGLALLDERHATPDGAAVPVHNS